MKFATAIRACSRVPLSVGTGALAMPGRMDLRAADFLSAFDAAGRSADEIAREVYPHGHRTSYMLTAAVFPLGAPAC
jgi:hypothetical protein